MEKREVGNEEWREGKAVMEGGKKGGLEKGRGWTPQFLRRGCTSDQGEPKGRHREGKSMHRGPYGENFYLGVGPM